MVIAVLEPVEKSHNPSRQLRRLFEAKRLGVEFSLQIDEIIKMSDRYGIEEHFMTDYGDEVTLSDPWSLFDEEDAQEGLAMAEKCFRLANEITEALLNQAQQTANAEPKDNPQN